jgi:hypothetical protein
MLSQRAAFAHGVIDGRTAQEFEPSGKAAEEVTAVYTWLCGIVGDVDTRARPQGSMNMAKRPSLFSAATAQATPSEPERPLPARKTVRPPSREGKRGHSVVIRSGKWLLCPAELR